MNEKPELEVTPSGEQPKFTPGPWVLGEDYSDDDRIVGGDGWEVATVERTPILPGWDTKLGIQHWSRAPGKSFIERSDAEVEANRRLIAAAPDMYAALRLTHACGTLRDDGTCDGCVVSAALALVDGPQTKETK